MPVVLEKREAGGAQVAVCRDGCGGLGGNARFTMVSRGTSPQFFVFNYSKVAHLFCVISMKVAHFLRSTH